MTHRAAAWLLACFALSATSAVRAAPVEFSSGSDRTHVIELYTSEGCSSCPPAERSLNAYAINPGLWRTYIPLAFHVDYWDYLGWKDRFAQPAFSQRQRRYVQLGRLRAVYTPAFIVDGRGRGPRLSSGSASSAAAVPGKLHVSVDGRRLSARLEDADTPSQALTLHVAVLGMGLTSHIEAGENAGRLAHHEFVVLAHREATSPDRNWQVTLPKPRIQAPRLAVAAWLSRPGDPTPLQATGGYLPR